MKNERIISRIETNEEITTIVEGEQLEGKSLFLRQYEETFFKESWESFSTLLSSIQINKR